MSAGTTIEWTDRTWSPTAGCSRISAGCKHCYAERFAHRFSGPGQRYEGLTVLGNHGPRWTGEVRLVPERLADPFKWRKPQRVFTASMSDVFHEKLSNEEIAAVFGVMAACPHITFQCLTKRAARMREWFAWAASGALDRCACAADDALEPFLPRTDLAQFFAPGRGAHVWPLPNVWLGCSVENQAAADERIPHLLETPAAVRFLSVEPQLEHVYLSPWLHGISWTIVGGESGPGARPFDLAWARSIVRQCREAGTAVFVKQLGAVALDTEWNGFAPLKLRDRKGGDMSEFPEDLRVREFPR